MKTTLALLLIALGSTPTLAADLGLSASSFKVKLYKFAVSTSPLCTNLRTIVDNGSTPVETELLGGARLGTGRIAPGTYPCVVIEMSDQLRYKPATNSTSMNCITTADTVRGICHAGDSSTKIDGSVTNCGTLQDDRIALYISTATVGTSGDAFHAPLFIGDTTLGIPLGTPLTVAGTASTGTFLVDTAGQVCDNNTAGCDGSAGGTGTSGAGECRLEGATFDFSP